MNQYTVFVVEHGIQGTIDVHFASFDNYKDARACALEEIQEYMDLNDDFDGREVREDDYTEDDGFLHWSDPRLPNFVQLTEEEVFAESLEDALEMSASD